MGTCIRCGNKTLRSDYLYCKKCYNDIVTECDECNEVIFDDDFFEIIIDEEVFHLCEKCFNNVLEHNGFKLSNVNFSSTKSLTREKYDSNHRTADGHYVKSRGEHLIDDFFFNTGIRHIYEKVVIDPTNNNECTCDFYLPDCDLYIEFWGVENSKKYNESREYKSIIYKNANLNLFEIEAEDVDVRLDYVIEKIKVKIKQFKKEN